MTIAIIISIGVLWTVASVIAAVTIELHRTDVPSALGCALRKRRRALRGRRHA